MIVEDLCAAGLLLLDVYPFGSGSQILKNYSLLIAEKVHSLAFSCSGVIHHILGKHSVRLPFA